MAIAVTCQCGKTYSVPESMAGKRAKCKVCGEAILIPAEEVLVPTAAEEPALPMTAESASPQIQADLEHIRRLTGTAASRPGRLRTDWIKYTINFPQLPSIALASSAIPALLGHLVHGAFYGLLLLGLPVTYLLWRKIQYQFIGGCINPGKIVSLDPPLVAVMTDLLRAPESGPCPVIRVLPQPLSGMTGGKPRLDQHVGTIAIYHEDDEGSPHWNTFVPTVAACVTRKMEEIDRVQRSLDDSDWRELDAALKQIPRPYEPGLYRIYPDDAPPPSPRWVHQHVPKIIDAWLTHDPQKHSYLAAQGIPPAVIEAARQNFAGGADPTDIVAVLLRSGDGKQGLALTRQGVFLDLGDTGPQRFLWSDVRGGFVGYFEFEITLRDWRRIRFSTTLLPIEKNYPLEVIFRAAAEGERQAEASDAAP